VSQKTATHYGDMVSHADTSDSLWTYDTHLVYSLHLPESGEYEAFFDGCCRWNELLNTPPEDYSKKAGWRIASHIRVSATSNALSFSPAIMSNFAQVQLKAQGPSGQPYPRSLVLTGADGAALASLVQGGVGGADISGRYTEIGAKLYVDTSVAVRDGGSRAAFLREDAAYSIVWFECPPGGELQFQYNRAYARRSGWAVVPGDARDALGRTPNPLAPGLPVLESLGGLWPEGAAYDAWRAQGPSYLPGAVSMEHDEAAAGAVRYSNTVQLHAYLPDDPLLAPFLPSAVFAATYGASLRYAVAPGATENFELLPGVTVDATAGVLAFDPAAVFARCGAARARYADGRDLEMCAFAVPVVVAADSPGGAGDVARAACAGV
jgi:hypothetical protein